MTPPVPRTTAFGVPNGVWLLAFQAFNAANFTIALGTPLILLARTLGAKDFQIGILNALPPALVALQLFATHLIGRYGYRQALLMGWGLRSFMLFLIAPLPLLQGVASPGMLVGVLILAVFLFNAIRGFASGAWLPWLSELIPAERRGSYLGMEQVVMNLSGMLTLLGSGWFLGKDPEPWRYCALFLFGWGVGMASVWCLARMPKQRPAPVPTTGRGASPGVLESVRIAWRSRAFRAAALFAGTYLFATQSLPQFLVLYVREELGFSEGHTLKLQAFLTFAVLLAAMGWGKLADRAGSRPVLRLALLGFLALVGFWTAAAAGFLRPGLGALASAYFLHGILYAATAVAMTRLILFLAPKDHVTEAMAVYQVFVALCGGAAPLLQGWALEVLRREGDSGAADPGYLVLFGSSWLLVALALLILSRIPEVGALRTRAVLWMVGEWPVRALVRARGRTRK